MVGMDIQVKHQRNGGNVMDRILFQIECVKQALLQAKINNNQLEIKRLTTKLNLLNKHI